MKKINFYGLILMTGIMSFMACGTSSSGINNSNAVKMWQSEVQGYLLSQHNQGNNLVYFFIKKDRQNENAYAFIITDQMDESDMMECLVNYTMAGDIAGIRTTKASANWYNNYSPVIIQDDYRGVSLAAFSLPKNIKKIWILVQNITINGKQANNKVFPFMPFELTEAPSQYYFINAGAGNAEKVISGIDHAEMEKCLSRTTFYATQVGTKFQLGYIAGKGQGLMLME
jgi:hypothetical protein